SALVGGDGSLPTVPAVDGQLPTPDALVVRFRDGAGTGAVTSRGGHVVADLAGTGFVKVTAAGDPSALVPQLRRDPSVESVSPDYARLLAATPNDTYYASSQQVADTLVRLPEAWDIIKDASSQVVAVLDSGVAVNQADLVGRTVAGYNVVAPGSAPD